MLYVIAGEGTGNKTEIVGSLEDLMAKAVEAEQEFWFAVQPGNKATTKTITDWLKAKEVYFASIETKIAGSTDDIDVVDPDPDSLVAFMQEYPDDNPEMLALFVDPDGTVDEDDALLAQVEAVVNAGYTVRLLNQQMTMISFATDDGEAVEEEQTGTLADDGDEGEQVEEAVEFTEADLKKMTVPELTAMAKGQGLDVKAIGKGKADLIAAVLAAQEEVPEGEEEGLGAALAADPDDEAPAPSRGAKAAANGDVALDAWVKKLVGAIGKALVDASK